MAGTGSYRYFDDEDEDDLEGKEKKLKKSLFGIRIDFRGKAL